MNIQDKVKNRDELLRILTVLKKNDKKIVFTNGCFDILHSGHVQYLDAAKKLGDVLIIGLNSDKSVKRLKGPARPINNESDRSLVLAALCLTDYVVIFDEDTPYNLINSIKPDVLVKGGDWKPKDIVGSDILHEYGGKVISLLYIAGKSTTSIINEVKELDTNQSTGEQ
jgi:rfaE bifunctional protein nucleotidyltransferase chain/domain